jgi:(4-(4-[2-(gamma-L-glutamylamino)ethyl]phenoxymethyl)furan-2-yl)methanamine synthase
MNRFMSRALVPDKGSWIALDIGGANIKVAHSGGQALTVPFEVWKRPDELGPAIAGAVAALPYFERAVVTMTAELCDCYPTKAVGVGAVLDAAVDGLPGCPVFVWGIDGEFHSIAEIRRDPRLAAASNWLALATLAARLLPETRGILIDIGTTTTDLIPLETGRVAARGRTDTERLQAGELVYAGVRRTPVCALANELPLRGIPTGLAAEIFASTLDVYLILGDFAPEPDNLSTADGRPATVEAARDRLARMVGADRDGFSAEDALQFARDAEECLIERLCVAAKRACTPSVGPPSIAVIAGSGSFLASRVARRLIGPDGTIISLKEAWGPVASSTGCAYSLLTLAAERLGGDPDLKKDPTTGPPGKADPA